MCRHAHSLFTFYNGGRRDHTKKLFKRSRLHINNMFANRVVDGIVYQTVVLTALQLIYLKHYLSQLDWKLA